MDALLALDALQSDTVGGLRDLYDVINVHTRNLQQFAICAQNYDPVLISMIRSKLPRKFMEHLSRQMPAGKWELEVLMEAFKNEVMSRERCVSHENNSVEGNDELPSSAAALVTQGQDGTKQKGRNFRNKHSKIQCIFCKGTHYGDQCTSVTDVETRKSIIRRKNRCYICLKGSHIARECSSNRTCRNCRGKHHVCICNVPTKDASNKEVESSGEQSSQLVVNTNNNCVLLQTALAKAFNCIIKKEIKIRVLFDNGSQRSFISRSLKNVLKLQAIRS